MKSKTWSNDRNVKIFCENLDEGVLKQIQDLAAYKPYQNSKIRVMPDCHVGIGCTIGTTMVIEDAITPNLAGLDLNCGMLTVKLDQTEIDLPTLDKVINKYIPSGFNIHDKQQAPFSFDLLTARGLNIERAQRSIGTLGAGNHFCEVARNQADELFLIIHTGSRNIGAQIAKYHQKVAITKLEGIGDKQAQIISDLKAQGRETEIHNAIRGIKKQVINKELAHLSGEDMYNYFSDVTIMNKYATLNRRVIADKILFHMDLTEEYSFETVHNYIDFKRMILRKGAVSAEKGEIILIPINMRDGSLIARGKGNPDWNYSAPHGAGRLFGRREAKRRLKLADFQEQMKDVYSTSVVAETLDEAPGAYKPMSEILSAIEDTAEVIDILKPIYNYKATDEETHFVASDYKGV
jgi:tRNA-splicing ligase RtcB (3'-phosphate/5'-hydroxy nucleic acid ligase)